MPEPMGGKAAGSNPGWLLRAGMASCAATAIAMRAAMQGIALKTLEVKVESESDARGLVGIPDAPSALANLRMSVRIGADGVDEAQLRELAAWGESLSPVSCTLRASAIRCGRHRGGLNVSMAQKQSLQVRSGSTARMRVRTLARGRSTPRADERVRCHERALCARTGSD